MDNTAIQELIQYFKQHLSLHRTKEIVYTTEEALMDAIHVCENAKNTKEKQQISKAVNDTIDAYHFYAESPHNPPPMNGNDYYNKTYNQ